MAVVAGPLVVVCGGKGGYARLSLSLSLSLCLSVSVDLCRSLSVCLHVCISLSRSLSLSRSRSRARSLSRARARTLCSSQCVCARPGATPVWQQRTGRRARTSDRSVPAAAAASVASLRLQITTVAPSSSSSVAICRPIPVPPPVTTATCPHMHAQRLPVNQRGQWLFTPRRRVMMATWCGPPTPGPWHSKLARRWREPRHDGCRGSMDGHGSGCCRTHLAFEQVGSEHGAVLLALVRMAKAVVRAVAIMGGPAPRRAQRHRVGLGRAHARAHGRAVCQHQCPCGDRRRECARVRSQRQPHAQQSTLTRKRASPTPCTCLLARGGYAHFNRDASKNVVGHRSWRCEHSHVGGSGEDGLGALGYAAFSRKIRGARNEGVNLTTPFAGALTEPGHGACGHVPFDRSTCRVGPPHRRFTHATVTRRRRHQSHPCLLRVHPASAQVCEFNKFGVALPRKASRPLGLLCLCHCSTATTAFGAQPCTERAHNVSVCIPPPG